MLFYKLLLQCSYFFSLKPILTRPCRIFNYGPHLPAVSLLQKRMLTTIAMVRLNITMQPQKQTQNIPPSPPRDMNDPIVTMRRATACSQHNSFVILTRIFVVAQTKKNIATECTHTHKQACQWFFYCLLVNNDETENVNNIVTAIQMQI